MTVPFSFVDLCAAELELCGRARGRDGRRPLAGRRAPGLRRRVHGGGRAARRHGRSTSACPRLADARRRRRRLDGRRDAARRQPPRDRGAQAGRHRDRPDVPAVLQGAARDPGGRHAHPALRRAGRQPARGCSRPPSCASASRAARSCSATPDAALHERRRHRRHLQARRLPRDRRVRLHRQPGPLGPLARRLPVHRRRRRRRRRQGRRRPRRHHLRRSSSYVQIPIEITIEQGRIADIRGGLRRRAPERLHARASTTTKAYGIAHIGWGCNEKARWSGLATDGRGWAWSRARSTATCCSRPGPTRSSAARTTRACHIDIPMRNCSALPRRRARDPSTASSRSTTSGPPAPRSPRRRSRGRRTWMSASSSRRRTEASPAASATRVPSRASSRGPG